MHKETQIAHHENTFLTNLYIYLVFSLSRFKYYYCCARGALITVFEHSSRTKPFLIFCFQFFSLLNQNCSLFVCAVRWFCTYTRRMCEVEKANEKQNDQMHNKIGWSKIVSEIWDFITRLHFNQPTDTFFCVCCAVFQKMMLRQFAIFGRQSVQIGGVVIHTHCIFARKLFIIGADSGFDYERTQIISCAHNSERHCRNFFCFFFSQMFQSSFNR